MSAATTTLHVGGASPYDVVVGRDLLDRLPGVLGEAPERVALVHAERLGDLAHRVRGPPCVTYDVLLLPVPDGEEAKTAAVAARCWESLGQAGFTRSDAVVTLGGGATTDLGGFVAATWLRGVRVVHLPTSLLAMVDAAVGGKTGINTGAGKNLVGSFHEPAGVLCDLALLDTLPREELVAGLGEVVKCGFIADPVILDLVESTDPADLTSDSPVLRELVERAIRVKIDVVVDDLKETGDATATPAARCSTTATPWPTRSSAPATTPSGTARRSRSGPSTSPSWPAWPGVLDDATADRHRTAFERVGLPTRWYGASYDELRAAMAVDKKARGSRLRFVVLSGVGAPQVLTDPPEEMLRAAYAVMTAEGVGTMKVLVLNGPNLGRLGRREPEIYGHTSYNELVELCVDWGRELGYDVEVRQTNHEGDAARLAQRGRRRRHPGRAERRRLDALLAGPLRRLRPAHRAAGRGAPQRPGPAAGGVPAHLGGHPARQGGGRRARASTVTARRCSACTGSLGGPETRPLARRLDRRPSAATARPRSPKADPRAWRRPTT